MLIKNIRSLSNSNKLFYVTTPIFYVNACPHIGHLYSAVITDCIYRYEKLQNRCTSFLFSTGTDEHGTKIQQAAQSHNQSLDVYCTKISDSYKTLFNSSNIQYTHFNRTSDKERHSVAVQHFWNHLHAEGNIYKTNYQGWYCVSDEMFLTESQLKEKEGSKGTKLSIESGHPVEWTEEVNYMFKLSKFQEDIIYWIKQGDRIKPRKFEKILMDLLDEPLPDISISRPSSRVHWGIPVPSDETQTVYVWLDALVNYLTSAGYPNENFKNNWPPSLQIIGKDILKFHGVYWPAFLIAAGLEPPNKLLVHSHWTVDGEKMSKSKQNVVNPNDVAQKYTYEGLRYFLLREGVPHKDGNYSDVKATRILNSELADTLGNLLSRACAKVINVRQVIPPLHEHEFNELLKQDVTKHLVDLLTSAEDKSSQHYESYNIYLVVDQVVKVLHAANNFVETFKPWELRKNPSEAQRLDTVLHVAFETLRVCGIILQPIIPEMSKKLLDKLNVDIDKRKWEDARTSLNESIRSVEDVNLGAGDAILFKRMR